MTGHSQTSTGVLNENVHQCEDCGSNVRETKAEYERYQGVEGLILLAFCPDCTEDCNVE